MFSWNSLAFSMIQQMLTIWSLVPQPFLNPDCTSGSSWFTKNYGKVLKRWEYRTTLPVSWETCMQVKKKQLELYMEQLTGSKLGKEYVKAVYCHPAYLTSMQSISCKMLGGWITGWNQDCQEKYQQPQICRWHHPYGRKWRGTKEPLDEGERGESKAGLKVNVQKN